MCFNVTVLLFSLLFILPVVQIKISKLKEKIFNSFANAELRIQKITEDSFKLTCEV